MPSRRRCRKQSSLCSQKYDCENSTKPAHPTIEDPKYGSQKDVRGCCFVHRVARNGGQVRVPILSVCLCFVFFAVATFLRFSGLVPLFQLLSVRMTYTPFCSRDFIREPNVSKNVTVNINYDST